MQSTRYGAFFGVDSRSVSCIATAVVRSIKQVNPFYGLLVLAGVLFAITSSAYCLMTLRGTRPELAGTSHGMLRMLELYGGAALSIELVVLGLATVGAMLTDAYWARRARVEREEQSDEGESLRGG